MATSTAAPLAIVTPPIRAPLTEEGGHEPQSKTATRDWWLYWNSLTNGVNQALTQMAALAGSLADEIRSGTHADRLTTDPQPVNALWMETDRDNVMYQVQDLAGTLTWVYADGTMTGSFSQLPADLGTNDIGFTFATSDTYEVYRWSGSTWVNQTPANDAQMALAAANLTLTTAMQDIPGATLTLARPGRYWIMGAVDFVLQSPAAPGDNGQGFVAVLIANGAQQLSVITFSSAAAPARGTFANQWLFTATAAGQIVKLQANKSGGTGTSFVQSVYTTLSAIWLGP